MKIVIYHCFGGSHSSVATAGIHLGLLPKNSTATPGELIAVPHFDSYEEITHGHFRFVGRINCDEAVYVLGKRTLGGEITDLINRIALLSSTGRRVYPVDTSVYINPLMVIGGFASRRLHLVAIGRPIVILGTRLAYRRMVNLVERVERDLAGGKPVTGRGSQALLLYVCDGPDPLAMISAARRLHPEWSEEEWRHWLACSDFQGKVGEVFELGISGGYLVCLVGARGGAQIVARLLTELRMLLQVPASCWQVVAPEPGGGGFRLKLYAYLYRQFGGRWLTALVKETLPLAKEKETAIERRLNEGVLD